MLPTSATTIPPTAAVSSKNTVMFVGLFDSRMYFIMRMSPRSLFTVRTATESEKPSNTMPITSTT